MSKKNKFTAPKEKDKIVDLRDRCKLFKMTAESEEEEELLSHLYRCLWISGGKITVELPGDASFIFTSNVK